jgi:myo-inositol-1(or 4)-monophosphatase
MTQPDVAKVMDVAISLAVDAGRLLRHNAGRAFDVQFKGEIDLVTEIDKAAEQLIGEGINGAFPDHAMLGEEGTSTGVAPENAEWIWIVDPIDGTTNFAHGYPHFAVSIAVVREGVAEVGVVYDPSRDELFAGLRDGYAQLNGRLIRVSTVNQLRRSLLGTGFSYDLERRDEQHAIWNHLHGKCQGIRREGSAALGVAWVAAGRLDGFYERPINAWDVSAGAVIVQAAGGRATSLTGGPYDVFGDELTVSNGTLHDELVGGIKAAIAAGW